MYLFRVHIQDVIGVWGRRLMTCFPELNTLPIGTRITSFIN